MSILLKKAGIFTTIQDLGRTGHRRLGINPNGVMDRTAARLANIILGNNETEAVIEMHFPAPEIFFERPAYFAIGGAEFEAILDNKSIENWRTHHANADSILKFKSPIKGSRAYLAIKDGFEVHEWLGSRSTNITAQIGGFNGRKLQDNDRINVNVAEDKGGQQTLQKVSRSLIPIYSRFPAVRMIAGAEFELLTATSEAYILRESYSISKDSNRMGFRLNGKPLHLLHQKEMVSTAVGFGTIQLLPDGQLIVLMADHQTSGGYPRIGHIIEHDLPLIAQLGANDTVGFHLVSVEEAEAITMQFEQDIQLLKLGLRLTAK
ncbi:MAG: biotin-dependent carboxyltransferase family protein [Blastocatellia bacterium]